MSILIKGMEMPKNCDKCGFQSASRFCNAMSYNFCERTDDIGRPDWCPLIEVHTPHGRLIDATFEENHYGSMLLDPTPDVTKEDKRNARVIIDALRMARTVIEAEGSR